jgi:hypothetical protein
MQGHASAYSVLGLEPGAGREEIERAYRRLIKLHHPDRHGGDNRWAAEINRAYAELRRVQPASEPLYPRADPRPLPRRRARGSGRRRERATRSTVWSILMISLGALLLLQAQPLAQRLSAGWRTVERALEPVITGPAQRQASASSIEEPLNIGAVSEAAARARELMGSGNSESVAEFSRECHRALRTEPNAAAFDRCVAFDIAVTVLADSSPTAQPRRFAPSELTARQMNAGNLLSRDYLAIERRLEQLRTAVELELIPPAPEPPPLPPLD